MTASNAVTAFDYRSVANADTFEEIPVLDIGPYRAGVPGAREVLADNIRFIQETIGFYVVVNHGIPRAVTQQAYAVLQAFFALPDDAKRALAFDGTSVGYVAPRSTVYVTSTINRNTKRDLNETLVTAYDRPAEHPYRQQGLRFVGPNKWPSEVSGFRDAIVAFQREIVALGHKIVPLYALALGKPADFFDAAFAEPIMWTRNAHYPPVAAEDNQFGISPHSDHSFLTLLPLTEVPGLQVLTRRGKWVPATPVADGIVVNTGEFLNRWSNGRFIATPHRVVPPDHHRYSMASFFDAAPDTIADPADFAAPGASLNYEPVSMIDYVSAYVDRNYRTEPGNPPNVGATA
jgi:isopenicillin N synthase-like dioxygenase